MGRLDGKVAIITGASRGLGRELLERFADEGAAVVGASRALGFDLTHSADARRLVSQTLALYGHIDTFINNAGILTPRKLLIEVTDEEWDTSIATNLTAVFYCMREALTAMLPRGDGLILNLSSGVAHRAAPTWGAYAAAKWGVEGLTRLAAAEVSGSGIRIASANPGATRTDMRALAYPDEDPLGVKTPRQTAGWFVALVAGDIPFGPGDALTYGPGPWEDEAGV